MTPEAINITIAEHIGLDVCHEPAPLGDRWRVAYFTAEAASIRRKNWPSSASVRTVPNYCGDFAAVHDVECILTNGQRRYYAEMLIKVHPLHYDPCDPEGDDNYMSLFLISHMTALQRATALVHTFGKWKEAA